MNIDDLKTRNDLIVGEIELLMENMLLKIEKDDLKQKELKYSNEYTDITFQRTKNSINTNIIKNLKNIKQFLSNNKFVENKKSRTTSSININEEKKIEDENPIVIKTNMICNKPNKV